MAVTDYLFPTAQTDFSAPRPEETPPPFTVRVRPGTPPEDLQLDISLLASGNVVPPGALDAGYDSSQSGVTSALYAAPSDGWNRLRGTWSTGDELFLVVWTEISSSAVNYRYALVKNAVKSSIEDALGESKTLVCVAPVATVEEAYGTLFLRQNLCGVVVLGTGDDGLSSADNPKTLPVGSGSQLDSTTWDIEEDAANYDGVVVVAWSRIAWDSSHYRFMTVARQPTFDAAGRLVAVSAETDVESYVDTEAESL